MSSDGLSFEFADGKAPDAMRTIGEVATALGIRQHVLRYWEEQFPMLRPLKRSGGRRYYRPEDVRLVAMINRLVHHEGYTLRGARLAIAGEKAPPKLSRPDGAAKPAGTAEQLRAIRDGLAQALGSDQRI